MVHDSKECFYKVMAKCRLCGEVFDIYSGNNKAILIPLEADMEVHVFTYNNFKEYGKIISKDKFIHYHKDGSFGIGDFAGLLYDGEVNETNK